MFSRRLWIVELKHKWKQDNLIYSFHYEKNKLFNKIKKFIESNCKNICLYGEMSQLETTCLIFLYLFKKLIIYFHIELWRSYGVVVITSV
jgi:hypothetical protein